MIMAIWRFASTFITALKRLFLEKYTYRASALAFTTLLALVPLLSVIVSIIAIFPIFTRFTNLAQNYILANFVPTSGATIQQYLEGFIQQTTHLSSLGILFLFLTAVLLIITVEHTLNDIWQTPQRKKTLSIWIIYWLILIFAPVIFGLSIFLSSYLFSLSWFSGSTHQFGVVISWLNLLPLLINTSIFSILYTVVPNHRVKWRDGLLGGLTAAVLFEAAKWIFALYIKQFPSYELIYGALATIPIFLIWLYISWLIILYGALVTNTQYRYRISRRGLKRPT